MPNLKGKPCILKQCSLAVGGNKTEAEILYRILFWARLNNNFEAYDTIANWADDIDMPVKTYRNALARLIKKELVRKTVKHGPRSRTKTTVAR